MFLFHKTLFDAISEKDYFAYFVFVTFVILSIYVVIRFFKQVFCRILKYSKYPRRFAFFLSQSILLLYNTINLLIKRPKGVFGLGSPLSFFHNFLFPQCFLQLICLLLFRSMKEYSENMNCSYIFKNFPVLFIPIIGISALLIGSVGTIIVFNFSIDMYHSYFTVYSIFNDIFVVLFIVIPSIRLLKQTMRVDALKLMRKKCLVTIITNYFFIFLIVLRCSLVFVYSLPTSFVDKGTNLQYRIVVFISVSYFVFQFILFAVYHIYFLIQQSFLDSILLMVEVTETKSEQPSVYLQATNEF